MWKIWDNLKSNARVINWYLLEFPRGLAFKGSDVVAAVAQVRFLAPECLYALGTAQKEKKE